MTKIQTEPCYYVDDKGMSHMVRGELTLTEKLYIRFEKKCDRTIIMTLKIEPLLGRPVRCKDCNDN